MAASRAGRSAAAFGVAVLLSGCAPQPTPAPGAPDDCILLCAVIRSIAGEPEPAAVAPVAKPPKPASRGPKPDSKLSKPAVQAAKLAGKPPKPAVEPSPSVHEPEKPAGRKPRPRHHRRHALPPAPATAGVPLRTAPDEAPVEVSTVPRTPEPNETDGSAPRAAYTLLPGSAPIEEVTSRFMPMPMAQH